MNDEDANDPNDYLWSGEGTPDPLVASLERRLAPLRYQPPRPRRAFDRRILLLAAAAILLAIPFFFIHNENPAAPAQSYEVTLLDGAARVRPSADSADVHLTKNATLQFPVGAKLLCDKGARASIRIVGSGDITEVGDATIEGPGDVDLVRSSPHLEKLYMHRGILSARIAANVKPRLFQVGTPSGTAVDLGCIYSMHVQENGSTELRVSVGRVAFELFNKNIVVWSGARCVADKKGNVTTPVDESSGQNFKNAVERFDATRDEEALRDLLANARLRDAASLWHLLQSTSGAPREQIYTKLAELSPPPANIQKPEIFELNKTALEAWRVDIMGW